MMDITTKFKIGDVVFRGSTLTTKKQIPCPDCKGERKWRVVSPAGKEYEFACPRCKSGYKSERGLSLDYWSHEPTVERMTIGSVRTDTHAENPVEYMCNETGVGSGSVYKEKDFFTSREEAVAHAKILASTRNEKTDGTIVDNYNRALEISHYQISDAKIKLADDADRTRRVKLSMLIDEFNDCESIDEVRSAIDQFKWQ